MCAWRCRRLRAAPGDRCRADAACKFLARAPIKGAALLWFGDTRLINTPVHAADERRVECSLAQVAAARERAKYQEMQRSLRQEVAMWKKRSQRLSRGSCVVINELALLIEGGGDEPDLHEHSWGSEKEVAKSGPWKLDPIKNSVYKTHPRKEEAINLYQDWSIRVIRCFLRLGYDIDIGVTKQDPSARLGQKDPSNGTKKRMYALFQVEGKGAAQKIETDLQAYVKRLKYEGFTNTLKAAGNGVHEAMNTIYLVFWMKDEGTPPVAPDARPRGMAARASALVQSTLAGFLK